MRIVSLCPSLTELVFDLDRGDDLVGITKFCVHPVGAVDVIEHVGGTKDPDVGRIVQLDPDLVLMNDEENRREQALTLKQSLGDVEIFAVGIQGNFDEQKLIELASAEGNYVEAQDASFRRYARLSGPKGAAMLMDAPPPKEAVGPFLDVGARLAAAGLTTPTVIAADQTARRCRRNRHHIMRHWDAM